MAWLKELYEKLGLWQMALLLLTNGFGFVLGSVVTLLILTVPPRDLVQMIILVLA